jgi:hypothetical protein
MARRLQGETGHREVVRRARHSLHTVATRKQGSEGKSEESASNAFSANTREEGKLSEEKESSLPNKEPKFDVMTDGFPVEADVARGDHESALERDDGSLETARDSYER